MLDARLLPFALSHGAPEELVGLYDGPTPPGARWHEGGVLVVLLMHDTQPATLDALRALGLKIEDTAGDHLVVAACPLGRFDDLAMLDAVRRVGAAAVGAHASTGFLRPAIMAACLRPAPFVSARSPRSSSPCCSVVAPCRPTT